MRKVLVVIDMQYDFINGSLGTKEAQAIVPNVAQKIKEEYQDNGYEVIFTRDTHHENYLETQEGLMLPIKHCIEDTPGWGIIEWLVNVDNYSTIMPYVIFDKSTFGSIRLARYIRDNPDITEVELVGLCTDICVISNALLIKTYCPEVKITVDSNCCAGTTPYRHEEALEVMESCQIYTI